MCTAFFGLNTQSAHFQMVFNRDESYERPTEPLAFWTQEKVWAGRDQVGGGTWLAASANEVVVALTNIPNSTDAIKIRSRGELVIQAVTRPREFLDLWQHDQIDLLPYLGFNLMLYNKGDCWIFSWDQSLLMAKSENVQQAGIYVLSNRGFQLTDPLLIRHGNEAQIFFERAQGEPDLPPEFMFDSGSGNLFVKSPYYGTRSTTHILLADHVRLIKEWSWVPLRTFAQFELG